MADWNKPVASDGYASWPGLIADRDNLSLTMCDNTTGWSNIPAGAMRWDHSALKLQRYNGSTFADEVISVAGGGTGAATAATARANLGLGTMSTQAASAVAITGGAINSTPIGATTPSTGQFTAIDNTPIGPTVPSTGRFTTLRADYISHTIRLGQNVRDNPGQGNTTLGGALGFDATPVTGGLSAFFSKGQFWALQLNNNTGGGDSIMLLSLGGTTKSNWTIDAAGTYISSCAATPPSDYRLKDVLGGIDNAVALILQLEPLWYRWKHSGEISAGFLAHDIQKILPCAVTGKKDEVWDGQSGPQNPDGSFVHKAGEIKPQNWYPDRLLPLLVAANQNQERRLRSLEAETQELKSALARLLL
jgi:hypothetical protein